MRFPAPVSSTGLSCPAEATSRLPCFTGRTKAPGISTRLWTASSSLSLRPLSGPGNPFWASARACSSNVGFGGTILQDLKPGSQDIHAWTGRDRIHITKAARGTFPFQLYGSRPIVNSAHHQAVETTGSGLLVAQYSQDFVVEALYHEKLPVLGVQWHPERMCFAHARRDAEDGARLLRYFLSLL